MPDAKPTTLLQALLAVQAEVPNLKLSKDMAGQVAGNRKYRYLSLNKLHAEVLPLLNRHGLVWMTYPEQRDGVPILRYELGLDGLAPPLYREAYPGPPGGTVGGSMPLMLDKANSQGLGSAITYARRYALCAVLGIVADEDDDGAKASEPIARVGVDVASKPALMTDAQLRNMWKALNDADLPDERKDLILTACGIDQGSTDVTMEQGRMVRARLDEAVEG